MSNTSEITGEITSFSKKRCWKLRKRKLKNKKFSKMTIVDELETT